MSFVRQHRAATALGVVAVLAAGTIVAVALSSDGYQSRKVDLNDGGVWVTSNSDGLFGRLNKPAGSLDLALNPPGGAQPSYRLDVRQHGAAVTAWDQGSGKLLPVDVASGKANDDQGVPVSSDEQVGMGGSTLAVLDPARNRVWAQVVDTGTSLSSLRDLEPTNKPVVTMPKQAQGPDVHEDALAVGTDGTIYAASTSGAVAISRPSGDRFAKARSADVGQRLESVQITAVGSQVVVYDAKSGVVHLPGGRTVKVPKDDDARVQPPSDSGREVVIATTTELLAVPLRGGTARVLYRGVHGKPAAPTWEGPCVHAAWAGDPGTYARACGGAAAKSLRLPGKHPLQEPVFRVNRNTILLNDLTLGSVYDLDTLQEVDNWSQIKPPPKLKPSKNNKNNNKSVATQDQPPHAGNDTWGARPGRTTVVHVLDNDSDPLGAILSVSRLSAISDPNANVAIAPDGQSVEVALPATGARDFQFKYTVDDGRGQDADATVSMKVRTPDENEKPKLRQGFTQHSFAVSAGGTLDLPVLDDWRDFDGDPLVITKASVGKGTVTTAPSGRLDLVAPATGGADTITYQVSDGRSSPIAHKVPVRVLSPTDKTTAPPVAEPDIARGEVGKPITLKPLANDLPGADPTNPTADLAIAGKLASPAGTTVDTDLKSGTVTIVASRPGSFRLTYTASYGNAKFAHAPVRIDVARAPSDSQPPVAVPDTGVLYGQTAATIDVLANDFDPAGGVLVVQHAAPQESDALRVSIVDGRFLRVEALQPALETNPQVVEYTITNGLTKPVDGELTVTQVPPPPDDTPLAVDDYATVRSGDTTLVPVLDNDIDPAGATLDLLDDVHGAPAPGALTVTGENTTHGNVGAAFVSGKQVRFAAPTVATQTTVTVGYVARNPAGNRGAGTLHLTITPPPTPKNPDQPPNAEPVSSRVVSGETVRITIPTTGVDPDGDTANIVGITSAPKIGRIVSLGATSITYEAFPTESGTDRFGYIVSDVYGKTSRSTVSIGVAQASDPQPPVAVDDVVTAAPGAKVRADVMANDVLAPDDRVSIGSLRTANPELPASTKLVSAGGPIQLVAPRADGQSQTVQYSVTDGVGDPSLGTLTVRSQQGYVPPPLVQDVPATPTPTQTSTTVDVLAKAADPESLRLRVSRVFDTAAKVAAGKITLPVLTRAQNVVFQVTNERGGTAAGVIHVPARGTGIPYVRPNKLITIGRDKSKTVALSDYVIDPANKAMRLTTTDQLQAAPASGLKVTSPDPTHLTLTGTGGYNGPAAIAFEVTDGKSLNDPAGRTALITVQVQVGPDTPVLRCPSAPIQLVEGGPDRRLDIVSLCHVWVADRARLNDLHFNATWKQRPTGVDILSNGSAVIGLRATGDSKPGESGQLSVGVDGSPAKPSLVNVDVGKLGPASMSPISIDGVKAGSTATRDIRGSVSSPLRDPHVSIVSVAQTSDGGTAKTAVSGSRLSVTPAADSHGTLTFRIIATDVTDKRRRDRQFVGQVTMQVLNVPDAPGTPQPGRSVLSRTAVLSWSTPAANGAPIDGYQVQWSGGSQTCAASPCRIGGLTNGKHYRFAVRAHNAVGYSKTSAQSATVTPDRLPAAVAGVATSNPQDHTLTVSWRPVNNGSSAIKEYRVNWSGGGSTSAAGTAHSATARGLDNHNVYTFTVVAVNALGASPPASARGQSAGKPGTPAPQVAYADQAGTTTRAVKVSWNAVDPNGPGQATYDVSRNGTPICRGTAATSCNDTPATAHTYTYSVVATNGANHRGATGSKSFAVTGTPDTPQNVKASPTGTDGQLAITYTAPDPHGKSSRIECDPGCGSWVPPAKGTSGSHTLEPLGKDQTYTVRLRDCNEDRCGAYSQDATGHTDGPPHAPNVQCQNADANGYVTWTWNRPDPINGHRVSKFDLGGPEAGTTTELSFRKQFPPDGESHTLTVLSIDDRNEKGGGGSASCKDAPKPDPPPSPAVHISMGKYTTGNSTDGLCTSGCHFIEWSVEHFTPNKGYNIAITDREGFDRSYGFTTDGNGNFTRQNPSSYYGGPNHGGNGTIYGTVAGVTGQCAGNWQKGSGCG